MRGRMIGVCVLLVACEQGGDAESEAEQRALDFDAAVQSMADAGAGDVESPGDAEVPAGEDAAASEAGAPDSGVDDAGAVDAAPSQDAAPMDGGMDNEDAAATDSAAPSNKRVFVTSSTHTALLGGPDGADGICQTRADEASLGGVFKAWLSTLTVDAATRLTQHDVPIVRIDGTQVAVDWDALVATGGSMQLEAPIAVDENGTAVTGDVWTGTLANGTRGTADDCSAFDTADGGERAICGNATATDDKWTDSLFPPCSVALRLYCFEQ